MAIKVKALVMPDGTEYEFFGATYYATCSTSGSASTKTVSISGFNSENLVNGTRIVVRMDYAQLFDGTVSLNVSGTGAKNVRYSIYKNVGLNAWEAGEIVAFVYHNGVWYIEQGGKDSEILDLISDMYYKSGDTFVIAGSNGGVPINGYITSSTKHARFMVPVDKSLKNISTITCTALVGGVRVSGGGYMDSSTDSTDWLTKSDISLTITKASDRLVQLDIVKSAAFTNATNNSVVSMAAVNLTLEFS